MKRKTRRASEEDEEAICTRTAGRIAHNSCVVSRCAQGGLLRQPLGLAVIRTMVVPNQEKRTHIHHVESGTMLIKYYYPYHNSGTQVDPIVQLPLR